MFKLNNIEVHRNPTCTHTVNSKHFSSESLKYFDKDGFELTPLEQHYYNASGYQNKIGSGCLYNTCWQEPWFTLEDSNDFIIDHSMVLHRCDFTGDAAIQLYEHNKKLPQLNYLINCKKKWGLDFSLDYVDVDSNKIYEIIHIEQDSNNYEQFLELKDKFENFVLFTDWNKAAKVLLKQKEKWLNLNGMAQNDWKAKFFGYSQAESIIKTI